MKFKVGDLYKAEDAIKLAHWILETFEKEE